MIYGIGSGLRAGWLVVKWSQLLHEVGFTHIEPNKPMNWSEFFLDRLGIDNSQPFND